MSGQDAEPQKQGPSIDIQNWGVDNKKSWHILVEYEGATCQLEVPPELREEALGVFSDVRIQGWLEKKDLNNNGLRSLLRSALREGLVDNKHLNPQTAKEVILPAIVLCATSEALKLNPQSDGFVIQISNLVDGSFNFRFVVGNGREFVESMSQEARKGAKKIYRLETPGRDAGTKSNKKKPEPPRDPSLSPPIKPRPDRFLPALMANKDLFPAEDFELVRRCLEKEAMFVWSSRQIEDETPISREEIAESIAAIAEYGQFQPPFPLIWAETRDWLGFYDHDLGENVRIPASFGVAVFGDEKGKFFRCWTFCEMRGKTMVSAFPAYVSTEMLALKISAVAVHDILISDPARAREIRSDEHVLRAISRAGAERVIELILLLSTRGVEKKTVRQGLSSAQKKKKNQRHISVNQRDYVVIRVPHFFVKDGGGGEGGGGEGGRWVRPHLRRAYMWGKNLRPQHEQRWTRACLVNGARAAEAGDEESMPRREYRVT